MGQWAPHTAVKLLVAAGGLGVVAHIRVVALAVVGP
jgi:hypothetical protein